MSDDERHVVQDLRGTSRLAVDATQGITALIEEMHGTIGSGPAVLGRPLERPVAALTRVVYGGVSEAAGLVGAGVDRALERLAPLVGGAAPTAEHEAVLAAVNGVLGDYLEATDNPLAIPMRLRVGGVPMALDADAIAAALPERTSRLLITVHGSSMNDRQWAMNGHDHAAALASRLGWTRVDVHYNTGRHISDNGASLDLLLEQLLSAWPGQVVQQVVVLCHSMGGLVARSAVEIADARGAAWRSRLRAMVFLGTPHHGAPLERGGNIVDLLLGVSRYSRPFERLGKIRSAGVTDLRYGFIREADWSGRDRFTFRLDPRAPLALPDGVACYAVAGRVTEGLGRALPGDGLVTVASALGRHRRSAMALDFDEAHTLVAEGVSHLGLLSDPGVYDQLEAWLGSEQA